MNLSALIVYTRDLTGIYATDVVSDTLVTRWLNESYREVSRKASWSWLPITDLSTGTDTPVFDAQFHALLPYRAAIKVLNFVSDDTKRSEMYAAEFQSLLEDMNRYYLSGSATGSAGNLTNMVRLVRDMVGMYDGKLVTDAVIKMHVNRAYNELANRHDWDWLEATQSGALPAYAGGAHTVQLSNGTRRVLEAYMVRDTGEVKEMVETPNLDRLEVNTPGIYYDVTTAGQVRIAPEQEGVNTYRFRYTRSLVNLGDNDGPLFLDQFDTILVYRASASVLSMLDPTDKRIGPLMEEYDSLYQSMYTMYELSHDNRSIQMGQDGLETRRFYPWFRPA